MGQRRRRLSKSAEFDRVYRRGSSAGGRFLVLYAFERPHEERDGADARLGVSVGRRVGPAVSRNEIKRLIREAFWSCSERLPAGYDYVVVARADSAELVERERLAGIVRELEGLIGQIGLTDGGTQSP